MDVYLDPVATSVVMVSVRGVIRVQSTSDSFSTNEGKCCTLSGLDIGLQSVIIHFIFKSTEIYFHIG